MGIVLKRRDNAPIVKYVFGNVIEIIMIEKDFQKAVDWLTMTLDKIRNEEFKARNCQVAFTDLFNDEGRLEPHLGKRIYEELLKEEIKTGAYI